MQNYGLIISRIGLSFVLFWFGIQQLSEPSFWIGFVPQEVEKLSPIPLEQIVLINGGVEIILGTLLILGFYTRVVAALSALHLASIAVSLGLTPAGVRDWGLAGAFAGLVFTGGGDFSVDHWFQKNKNKNPS